MIREQKGDSGWVSPTFGKHSVISCAVLNKKPPTKKKAVPNKFEVDKCYEAICFPSQAKIRFKVRPKLSQPLWLSVNPIMNIKSA